MRPNTALKYDPAFLTGTLQNKPLESENSPQLGLSPLPQILCITSYPPRECGIATYSEDLIVALKSKFEHSFDIKICALELQNDANDYKDNVDYILKTDQQESYLELAHTINNNPKIQSVLLQHEFGLFRTNEDDFLEFLKSIKKPVIVALHTVLPHPDDALKIMVKTIDECSTAFIVMTNAAAKLLTDDYEILAEKISVIPHGTHLVAHANKEVLKEKYELSGRKIISTFGLLSSGKSIDTTINALQEIVAQQPEVLFLVIGKTHPTVVKNEGEQYRESLQTQVKALQLEKNVLFINKYMNLEELLEYLQLTDIYLFTSKDRNQAVSGTFSYAISCGCPVISTPIPHAIEVLKEGSGVIVDFENPKQLAKQVIRLLKDDTLRKNISANGIHQLAPTAWENSAIGHALLFEKIAGEKVALHYQIPPINLDHLKHMTTDFGMIQFAVINQPDINSGYTLDDNARALVAMCQHLKLTRDEVSIDYIKIYFNFIKHCLQPEGYFLNYVNEQKKFTKQNNENLADSNGRAIWALGYMISIGDLLPQDIVEKAQLVMRAALSNVHKIYSPRAMAFIIKGIYYSNKRENSIENTLILKHLADRLVQMYKHESTDQWQWFESYLTYGNSILPEAMLCAYSVDKNPVYKEIAQSSFNFLLAKIFTKTNIKVISNKGWLHSDNKPGAAPIGGEQPIDVAYTILALRKFYKAFGNPDYLKKMKIAFSWFLGNNHMHQIIYNPCTGGCYDGLETDYINLNQGAESTVSYLMARFTVARHFGKKNGRSKISSLRKINLKKATLYKT